MGMAMSQCPNHNSQDTNGLCKCVTVKVIKPVAVTAVSNCSKNVFIVAITLRESVDLPNLKVEVSVRES